MGLRPTKADRLVSPSHARAKVQEKQLAARLGGKAVKGSGSGDEKGDVRVRGVSRIEAKCTKHKSFSVTLEMIEKIEAAALSSGEVPAMEIEFLDANGNPTHRIALVPTYVLEMLTGGVL